MNKTIAIYLAAAAMVSCGAAAFAQDSSANMMVSVPGLNLQVGARAKDDLLAGTEKFAQGASKVTEINLDPTTMSMMGPQYGPEGNLVKKMTRMVVHTYQYDKPGMYRMDDVQTYAKKLEDGSWNCPVVSREKEKDQERLSYICTKTGSDQVNEMVVLTAQSQQLTFIHMAGTMSLNDLTHMSDSAHNLSRQVGPRGNGNYFVPGKAIVVQTPQKFQITPVTPATPATPVTPAPPAQ